MDCKFTFSAECRVDNVDIKVTAEELAKALEEDLGEAGIKAVVDVTAIVYVGGEHDGRPD